MRSSTKKSLCSSESTKSTFCKFTDHLPLMWVSRTRNCMSNWPTSTWKFSTRPCFTCIVELTKSMTTGGRFWGWMSLKFLKFWQRLDTIQAAGVCGLRSLLNVRWIGLWSQYLRKFNSWVLCIRYFVGSPICYGLSTIYPPNRKRNTLPICIKYMWINFSNYLSFDF